MKKLPIINISIEGELMRRLFRISSGIVLFITIVFIIIFFKVFFIVKLDLGGKIYFDETLIGREQEFYLTGLEKYIPNNSEIIDIRYICITGEKPFEAVVLYLLPKNPKTIDRDSGIIVGQYNINRNSWEKVYQHEMPSWAEILDKGKLSHDTKEQVLIGSTSGSGEFLDYILIGSEDGIIKTLLEGGGYYKGCARIKNDALYIGSGSQGIKYEWFGSFVGSPVLINPDPKDITQYDIVIHYSIDENGNITASVPNKSDIFMHTNQRLFLVRDNIGQTERILRDYHLEYDERLLCYTSNTKGEYRFSIMPYENEKALNLKVIVD